MGEAPSLATVAVIRRPWGRRGEVIADPHTDFPERLKDLRGVILSAPGVSRDAALESVRQHQGSLVLKFAGVDSISAAEALAGCEVQIPASQRRPLPQGQVYWDRLAGCRVVERGREIGVVRHLDPTVGTPVLVVDTPHGELLVPFAADICRRTDTDAGVIEVELPEGLHELNR